MNWFKKQYGATFYNGFKAQVDSMEFFRTNSIEIKKLRKWGQFIYAYINHTDSLVSNKNHVVTAFSDKDFENDAYGKYASTVITQLLGRKNIYNPPAININEAYRYGNTEQMEAKNKTIKPQEKVTVYPNPAQNEVTIEHSKYDIAKIEIYNSLGNLVHEQGNVTPPATKLSLENFASGIYIIRSIDKNQVYYTYKIIKQ